MITAAITMIHDPRRARFLPMPSFSTYILALSRPTVYFARTTTTTDTTAATYYIYAPFDLLHLNLELHRHPANSY